MRRREHDRLPNRLPPRSVVSSNATVGFPSFPGKVAALLRLHLEFKTAQEPEVPWGRGTVRVFDDDVDGLGF